MQIFYDPNEVTYATMIEVFWRSVDLPALMELASRTALTNINRVARSELGQWLLSYRIGASWTGLAVP